MYVSLRSAHVVTKLLKASFDLQYFTTIRPGLVIFLREVVLFEIFVVQLSLIVSESSLTVLGTLFRSALCGIKHSETSFNWLDHKTWYCYVFVGCTRFIIFLCVCSVTFIMYRNPSNVYSVISSVWDCLH